MAESVDLHIPTTRINVGPTVYSMTIPRSVARKRFLGLAEGFVAPIAYVKVRARDAEAARVLAAERFAESSSILDVIDRPKLTAGRTMMLRRQDGTGHFAWMRRGWIINYLDDRGRLEPPYYQLSRALSRPESVRSDWERRVLAATRWFSRSCSSAWPADRLANLMVALECLFVSGQSESKKGALIAERLTERFRMRDMTEKAQAEWLLRLYKARNQAVHEGRDYIDDLEVDRLTEVMQYVIRASARHLVPAHRTSGRSCRTFEAALRCSKP